jgi:hypothetical protein
MSTEKIGLFYRLPGNRYVVKAEDCTTIEPHGGFRDSEEGHFTLFKKEIYPKYVGTIPELIEDYTYYPRGRVLYREKDQQFIIYADRCLLNEKDKKRILRLFGLRKARWRKDEQYQCAGCNKELKRDILLSNWFR